MSKARSSPAGILPSQTYQAFVAQGRIAANPPVRDDQIQPASIDLRLGTHAYRVAAGFMPGPNSTVAAKLDRLKMHSVDLRDGAVLERGCVYIIPLLERLKLPADIAGTANPKSTTGRLDIFTRLLCDHAREFEKVPAGYEGPLYLEVSPRTFSILARTGQTLNQLRLRRGVPSFSDKALAALDKRLHLVFAPDENRERAKIGQGLWISIDLEGPDSDTIGYRARHNTPLVDLSKIGHYDPAEFWEPLKRNRLRSLVLNPDDFYILVSREKIRVPHAYAAEMVPYDTSVGEFRIHYAGFFDPGFGYGANDIQGTRAVLEVRSHDVPFLLEHGQVVGRFAFEKLTSVPDRIYGMGIGSNYQRQGLTLAKQFKRAKR
ncbi:MAG: 2'-deoxycytidine 5'-triphosphate deaminase [Proteobacteria bacterium]|nr:2'-deoxycytidine 5'-triphosphate deaminase [Pseudomonadota bacterium]